MKYYVQKEGGHSNNIYQRGGVFTAAANTTTEREHATLHNSKYTWLKKKRKEKRAPQVELTAGSPANSYALNLWPSTWLAAPRFDCRISLHWPQTSPHPSGLTFCSASAHKSLGSTTGGALFSAAICSLIYRRRMREWANWGNSLRKTWQRARSWAMSRQTLDFSTLCDAEPLVGIGLREKWLFRHWSICNLRNQTRSIPFLHKRLHNITVNSNKSETRSGLAGDFWEWQISKCLVGPCRQVCGGSTILSGLACFATNKEALWQSRE